jgi:hypothetical protein
MGLAQIKRIVQTIQIQVILPIRIVLTVLKTKLSLSSTQQIVVKKTLKIKNQVFYSFLI